MVGNDEHRCSRKGALSGRWYSWDCWECLDLVFHRLSCLATGAVFCKRHNLFYVCQQTEHLKWVSTLTEGKWASSCRVYIALQERVPLLSHCNIVSTEKEMALSVWVLKKRWVGMGRACLFKSPECFAVLPDQSFKYSQTSAVQQMCQWGRLFKRQHFVLICYPLNRVDPNPSTRICLLLTFLKCVKIKLLNTHHLTSPSRNAPSVCACVFVSTRFWPFLFLPVDIQWKEEPIGLRQWQGTESTPC